ncbi:MAG: DUF934 domain-containing protein [Aestuariivirga sp.]|uniref:DUF934 domain-containing protein n=1 Tax=Aestuariivirga sp. TaxID=2650926 RepID=UPI0025C08289|nr:DUF934 domain-containing protein [Aestuariivirga sp.]MCA3560969.1 DUF934 domain-containing protein [Aestuariivirga sp.]
MPLLKNNVLVPDTWINVEAEGALPETGDVIVPFARLLKEWGELSKRNTRLGLRLSNTDKPEALSAFLPGLSLIVLPFPAFNDGRAYSIARSLREMGYAHELRATGNVLPDQLQFMLQVGFDAFEIGKRFPLETWAKASRQMSLAYQRGLFRRGAEAEIWTERHTDAEPWLEQPHAG